MLIKDEYKQLGYWYTTDMVMQTHDVLFITDIYHENKIITTITSTGWELDISVDDIIKSHIRDIKIKQLGI